MRLALLAIFLVVVLPARAEDEEHTKGISVYAGPEIFHDTVFSPPNIRVRPRLGGEFVLPDAFIITTDLTFYSVSLPSNRLRRARLNVGVSYGFFGNRLEVGPVISDTSTSYDKYGSASAFGYGLRAKFNQPLGEHFRLAAISGWDYEKQVTLSYDTGQPLTTSPVANGFCSVITFGFTSDCGNRYEYFTVPSSHQLFLTAALEYLF